MAEVADPLCQSDQILGATETAWYTRRGFLDANQAATIRLPAGVPAAAS